MSYTIIRPETREDWLEERKKGIGSSEVGAILGCSTFATPYKVWGLKLGIIPPDEENESMMLGHLLEDAVAQAFSMKTGATILEDSKGDWIARDTDHPFLQVSPDRLYYEKNKEHIHENLCILECKTKGSYIDEDTYPDYWYPQVQYQMGVMGVNKCCIAWLCSDGRSLRHMFTEIPFNKNYYEGIIKPTLISFWHNNIETRTAPPTRPEDNDNLKYTKAVPNTFIEADDEVKRLLEKLTEKYFSCKETEGELQNIQMQIKDKMGDRAGISAVVGKKTVTLLTFKNTADKETFNENALKTDSPEIYAKYLRSMETFDEEAFRNDDPERHARYVTKKQGTRYFTPKWAALQKLFGTGKATA